MKIKSNMFSKASTYELTHESVRTTPRHCEERLEGERQINLGSKKLEGDERRGNLPSLTGWQELFTVRPKITLMQVQSREIASRVQQSQLSSFFIQYIRRLAMTNVVVSCVGGCSSLKMLHVIN
jgi:hypothetical protein